MGLSLPTVILDSLHHLTWPETWGRGGFLGTQTERGMLLGTHLSSFKALPTKAYALLTCTQIVFAILIGYANILRPLHFNLDLYLLMHRSLAVLMASSAAGTQKS